MPLRRLQIALDFGLTDAGVVPPRSLGVLAEDGPRLYFFYDPAFVERSLPVSPYRLAVGPARFEHHEAHFDYIPGLIADALPDGWGRLLQDRAFAAHGLPPERVTVLDRLSALGSAGMGALTFRPETLLEGDDGDAATWPLDLAALAAQATRVLAGSAEDILPELRLGGGSPGGARPKVLAGLRSRADGGADLIAGVTPATVTGRAPALPPEYDPYLVKFGAEEDVRAYGRDAGAVEEAYARMARAAGLDMPDTRLLPARDGQRHFAIRRFDRHGPGGAGRLHMHTLAGLLHASHRLPSLDYESFLTATAWLTRDRRAVVEAFRRAAFNVFAHNRDDHTRNFAYLMDAQGVWRLAPGYDLTFSSGPNGYHTTSVQGEAAAPTAQHLVQVAVDGGGLEPAEAEAVITEVADAVGRWPEFAREVEIAPAVSTRLDDVFTRTRHAALPAGTVRGARRARAGTSTPRRKATTRRPPRR